MAGGIKALRFIQIGSETTAGTAVAATTIWRGLGTLQDARETVFPEEDIGLLPGTDRSYVPKLEGAISFESVPATFEQLPYILNAGIEGTTGAQDGTAGSGYVYSYAAPTTAKKTPTTYTIEGGDDQQAEEMEYAFVSQFQLTGAAGQAVMMQADWIGRQVATTTKTAGLSIPVVEEILFGNSALYIDTAGGTVGSTQVSDTLVGAELTVVTGHHAKYTGDNVYFSYREAGMPEITLNVTFLHNSSAVAEKAAWRNQTPRQLRWLVTGSSLTTSGTHDTKKLILDLAGKWESFEQIDEQDGNDVVTGVFRARYNATAALFAEFVVVNELSALP